MERELTVAQDNMRRGGISGHQKCHDPQREAGQWAGQRAQSQALHEGRE
jgi:hypothetical protein